MLSTEEQKWCACWNVRLQNETYSSLLTSVYIQQEKSTFITIEELNLRLVVGNNDLLLSTDYIYCRLLSS